MRRNSGRIVRFSDGSYGRIVEVKGRESKRISKAIRGYIDFMFDKLLEWLEDEESIYDEPEEMLEDVDEYIHEKLIDAPEHLTPCDNGALSVPMFVDYVFEDELWSDSYIADNLLGWVFEPEDMRDCIKVVSCYEELLEFRDALKSIKVKIVEGGG
jgi:hypothetical protein